MPPLTQRKALTLLIFSHFSVDLYGAFLAPLQPFLIQRHQLSLTKAGILVSLYSISASLLQPVYGYWADRLGRRFFVMLAPLVASVFMTMLPLSSSYAMVMMFLFIAGTGVAAFHPQASSLSHAVSGTRKGLGMSLFISGGNLGSAVGPLYLIFFIHQFGIDSTYLAAIPGIALTVLLLFYCPAIPRQDSPLLLREMFQQLRRWARPLGALYGIVVLRTLVQLSFITFIPVLLSQMGLSAIYIGAAVTCLTGSGAIGGLAGGFLYDRIGGRNLFLLSSALSPIFLFLAVTAASPAGILLNVSLAGFFVMMTIPVSVLMGQSIVPHAISTVSSLMMGFGWGVGGMLVPIVGRLADLTSIQATLQILALVPILYGGLAWKLPQKDKVAFV
jgi:FSR family fosmidomycin resistance protein-like MFS transporter